MSIPNQAKTTCLRPLPEKMTEFMPLWDQRNLIIAEKDKAIEAMFAAAQRGDTPAYEQIKSTVQDLQTKEDALSAEMRPLQFKAWEHVDNNLVTTVGKNDLNDKYWRASGYTQTVVMGLKGTGAPAVGDTQASHAGWSEVGGANAPAYTGNRKAVTMGASSGGSTVSPQQTFAITSTGTVSGLFMNNGGSATKDDTTGVLVSAVNFTGGDEAVNNLDSLLVTYTFNQA